MSTTKNHAQSLSPLIASVGKAVKKCRLNKNLTLAECSERAGVSATMISKIERAVVAPSLSTLEALACSFDIPVANFFSSTIERKEISYVPSGRGMTVRRQGCTYGYDYQLIGRAGTGETKAEAFVVTVEETATPQPMLSGPGLEFIKMLEGSMLYQIGNERYEMRSGDCLTFDAEAPHGPIEVTTRIARFLYVTFDVS